MNCRINIIVLTTISIGLLYVLAGCVKDKPNPPAQQAYIYEPGDKVYFVNEGNYGSGNASLAIYNPLSGNLYNNVYATVNGKDVGDVLQSVMVVDNELLLAVDNSHKLITVDLFSQKENRIVSIPNPRYMLPIRHDKVYVSSLYSSKIYNYNPLTYTLESVIHLPSISPERMIMVDGYVYAASWDTANRNVYRIDPRTDEVITTIDIGHYAPQALVADFRDNLWIFYGNSKYGKPYGVVVWDVHADTIVKTFDMGSTVEMIKPVMNTNKDTIYWLGVDYAATASKNGVFKMAVDDKAVPDHPFIPAARFQYFYALGYDDLRQVLYIGDPKSFTERSDVYIYDLGGNILKKLTTGIGIGCFYFQR